jgi:hypothetical protein
MLAWYGTHQVKGKAFSEAYRRGLDILVETPDDEIDLLLSDKTVPGEAYLQWLADGDAGCQG